MILFDNKGHIALHEAMMIIKDKVIYTYQELNVKGEHILLTLFVCN